MVQDANCTRLRAGALRASHEREEGPRSGGREGRTRSQVRPHSLHTHSKEGTREEVEVSKEKKMLPRHVLSVCSQTLF